MQKAKVFVLDLDKGVMEMIISALEREGHQVVLTAHDYFEAQKSYKLALDKGISVAVIDTSPVCSQEIAEILKRIDPALKIVGFGWYHKPDWGNILDVWVDKATEPGSIGNAVTKV